MNIILPYPHPLKKCKFVKRYKRFLVDVLLDDGSVETVHCANSGSMKSCLIENTDAYILNSFNSERKLPYSLELFNLEDGLACLNTSRANSFVEKILQEVFSKKIKKSFDFSYEEFLKYNIINREVKFNEHTRFDFCLSSTHFLKKCWIEVKTVSLMLDSNTYAFPDAVTQRGQKHLKELMYAKENGDDAWLFFVLMRL